MVPRLVIWLVSVPKLVLPVLLMASEPAVMAPLCVTLPAAVRFRLPVPTLDAPSAKPLLPITLAFWLLLVLMANSADVLVVVGFH